MEVQLFVPCFIDQLYPETAFRAIRVMEKAGMKVRYNPAQTCCGQAAFNSGYWDEARIMAEKFMSDFPGDNAIVGLSGSCCGMIREQYPVLFEEHPLLDKAKDFGKRVFEFSDFLVNQIHYIQFGARLDGLVTLHESCAAKREYGLKDEPRILLEKVEGLKISEMEDPGACCGFGGSFSMKFTGISSAMVQQKLEQALATGARYIVSTELSCLMNMEAYIRKQKLNIGILHLADVLATGWD